MLNQSINLYQERFKDKRILFSATQSLAVSVLVAAILLLTGYWYADRLQRLQHMNEEYLLQRQQAKQQMEVLNKQLQKLLSENELDQQINRVSHEVEIRHKLIEFVDNNQFGSGQGFSEQLAGLSEVATEGVWLNNIYLSDEFVRLAGSSLQEEKVPEYFNQFRDRSTFNGKVFDIFELQRQQNRTWKVDFVIASTDLEHD